MTLKRQPQELIIVKTSLLGKLVLVTFKMFVDMLVVLNQNMATGILVVYFDI